MQTKFFQDNFKPFYVTLGPPANFPPLPYHPKPMATENSSISKAKAQMRCLESNFADLNITLQLFLTQQANMRTPHILPSILNPASEDPHTTSIPKTPHKQISNAGYTHHIKPLCPNEFGGNCMKGQAFLNSCELYMALAPHQFADDHAKIMWALSFMKSGHTACFVECQM
jgi:hypothetical protein